MDICYMQILRICGICKYYAFLYRELEHLQLLVSTGIVEPIPHEY